MYAACVGRNDKGFVICCDSEAKINDRAERHDPCCKGGYICSIHDTPEAAREAAKQITADNNSYY